jgi:hypothetical protein
VVVEAEFLSFNKDVNGLLLAFFETITDDRVSITVEPGQPPETLMARNVYAVVSGSDPPHLLTRVPKGEPIELIGAGSLRQTVRSESRLHLLCSRIARRFVYSGEPSDLSPIQGIRLAWKHKLPPSTFSDTTDQDDGVDSPEVAADKCPCSFSFAAPSSCVPLFLPHASRWNLSEARSTGYAEFLCEQSILSASLDAERECDFCHKPTGPTRVLVPFKTTDYPYVHMMCGACVRKDQSSKDSKVRQAVAGIGKQFALFKSPENVPFSTTRRPQLTPILQALDANIAYLRAHPIGSLREMIPRIDRAFQTLQRIVETYQRWKASSDDCPPFQAVLGIRDETEAKIQLPNWDPEVDASKRPIDVELFSTYLDLQQDVQFASPPFRLVHGAERALADLNEAFSFSLISQQLQFPAGTFGIHAELSRVLSLTFTFSGECRDDRAFSPIQRFSYELFPIASESHLGLSSVAAISTHLNIDGVWIVEPNQLLIVASSARADRPYRRRKFYLVPMGHVSLTCRTPLWTTPHPIKWGDAAFRSEFAIGDITLAFSYELVGDRKIATIRINLKTGEINTDLRTATERPLAWHGDLCYFDPDQVLVMPREEEDPEDPGTAIEELPVRLIALPTALYAITREGQIFECRNGRYCAEETRLPRSIPPTCPLLPHPGGFLAFPSPAIPFDPREDGEDRVNVRVHRLGFWAGPAIDHGLGNRPFKRSLAHNQAGLSVGEEEPPAELCTSLWNFHLSAAEFLPVLMAYAHVGRMWAVTRGCAHFRATQVNRCFTAAVSAFYTRTVAAISLHHIEDLILRHGLRVNIIGFVAQMDEDRVAQYIDAVAGTRLCFALIPGVWAGIRVVGDLANVMLFVRGMTDNAKLQMASILRGANVVNLCTSKVIGTLNFVADWRQDFPSRNYLGEKKVGPSWSIHVFMPRETNYLNPDAITEYRAQLKLPLGFIGVPFVEDWNHPHFDELSRQEEVPEVIDYWNATLTGQVDKGFRPIYDPKDGILVIKQIAATYLTLCEFQDLPRRTVLGLCNLRLHQQ